eukprot:scaffold21057_cov56-Attheya_sp.AAC.1
MDYACWQGKGLHNADSIYPSCLDARLRLDHCECTVYSIEPCPNASNTFGWRISLSTSTRCQKRHHDDLSQIIHHRRHCVKGG